MATSKKPQVFKGSFSGLWRVTCDVCPGGRGTTHGNHEKAVQAAHEHAQSPGHRAAVLMASYPPLPELRFF